MQLADFVNIPKKLNLAWSSGTMTRQLSLSLLADIYSNFGTFEKKIKMRILLSFIGLDPAKKNELSQSLQRLLHLAREEESKEVWVSITSRLVYERLFGAMDNIGNGLVDTQEDKDYLKETSDTIIERLLQWSSSDSSSESSSYFQPLEFRYLQSSWIARLLKEEIVNTDFNYMGSAPDFIGREKERQLNDQNSRAPSLMRVKMNEPIQQASSSSASNMFKVSSLEAAKKAKVVGGGLRVQTKMITLDDLQAKKALESKAELDGQKLTGAKRKAAAVAAAAAGLASGLSITQAAGQQSKLHYSLYGTGNLLPASDRVAEVDATEPISAISSTAADAAINPNSISALATTQTDPQSSQQPPAPRGSTIAGLDIPALFAEAPLLTDEEKIIIRNFFSANNPYPKDTPIRRMKLRETDTGTGRESIYLVLKFSDNSYQKTKKFKAKK